MLQLIHCFLQQDWQVIFASAANLSEHRYDLTAIDVEEKIIALNCSSFDAYLAELQPDMVLFDRFFTEEQFGWRVAQTCPDALRVLNTEDLHSLRQARHHLLKNRYHTGATEAEKFCLIPAQEKAEDLFSTMASDAMVLREVAAIYRCDISLMISRAEIDLLQQAFAVPQYLLHYCPFLLEPATAPTATFAARQDFITIGNFRHEPNWDAVLCLKHDIWPRIRAQLPAARLNIFGAYPPPKATALHNPKQGFLIAGWAEDARAVMQQARVCLAPLRFGAGIKGKLVDAMQCATPSVTTPIGAEAMHEGFPWPGAIADNSEDFVKDAVHLYQDEQAWHAAQAFAAAILRAHFSAADFSSTLINHLRDVAGQLSDHRRKNFVGAMLQHHQHKSTQYMSLWIEAKGKLNQQP